MRHLYLAILVMICFSGYSQPPQTFRWGVKAGGPGDDKVSGITSLGDNLYITGQFSSRFTSGNHSVPEGSGSGIYLSRLSNKGTTEWLKTLSGDKRNNATRITSSGDHVLVAGTSQGTIVAEKSEYASEGQALFVSSWNEKGKVQWLRQYPFKGFATLDVLENTQQGGILTGGMFQGQLTPAGFEQNSSSDKRAYLLLLTAEGKPQKLWVSTGKGSHRLVAASTAGDGSRYLLFSITGDFGFGGLPATEPPRRMEYGLALVKTNPSGDAQWIQYMTSAGYLEGIKVLALSSGNPLVCANYTGKVSLNDTIMGTEGYMASALWLFSPDGRLKKTHTLSSPATVRVLDAMLTPSRNILVTGYFRQEYTSPQQTVRSKLSFGDILLLQTDTLLTQVWHDEPGEDAFSFGKSFTLDRTGNLVLAGAFSGKLDLRGQRLESAGGNDILVAQYYNCLQKKASIRGNTLLCEGGNTTLSVTGDYNTYLWNGQWGQSSLTVKQPGVYSVLAYDQSGCGAADTVQVRLIQKNSLGLPERITVSPNQPVLLSATEGFSQYRWSDGLTTWQREVAYSNKVDSLYLSLVAVSGQGCEARDSVSVKFAHSTSGSSGEDETSPGKLRFLSVKTWPNPVTDKLYWNINQSGSYFITLFDERGGVLFERDMKTYQEGSVQSIDMSMLANSVYVLNIKAETTVLSFKIMKR